MIQSYQVKFIKEDPVLSPLDQFALEDIYLDRLGYETVERLLPQLEKKTVQMIRVLRHTRHALRCGGYEHLEVPVSEIATTLEACGLPVLIGHQIETLYQNRFPQVHSITMEQLEEHELELIKLEMLNEFEDE